MCIYNMVNIYRADSFEWDEANINHVARHHVTPDEVEELFEAPRYITRSHQHRYSALGRTATGRFLYCVFVEAVNRKDIRIITARDMTWSERKLYGRKIK